MCRAVAKTGCTSASWHQVQPETCSDAPSLQAWARRIGDVSNTKSPALSIQGQASPASDVSQPPGDMARRPSGPGAALGLGVTRHNDLWASMSCDSTAGTTAHGWHHSWHHGEQDGRHHAQGPWGPWESLVEA